MTHMPQLDALRAFAVLAVFAQHALPEAPLVVLVGPGTYGVDLFFVLSGYLITRILVDCRDAVTAGQPLGATIRRFYIRRFLRIVPVFYLLLVITALLDVPPVRETFWWHATYLSNLYFARHGAWNGPVSPFWSLAIEEQFYLLWPWVVLFTARRHLGAVILLLVVGAPAVRWLYWQAGVPDFAVGLLPFGNADFLLIGALLAVLQYRGARAAPLRRALGWIGLVSGPLTIALLILVATGVSSPPLAVANHYVQTFLSHVTIGLLGFWLVDRASAGFAGVGGRLLCAPPLRYVGRISYGLYLCHTFVILGLTQAYVAAVHAHPTWLTAPPSNRVWFACRLGASLAVAALSWHAFEQPINALKRHFPYATRPAIAEVPDTAPAI